MKTTSYTLILIALALAFAGCKKEKDEPVTTGVYLKKMTKAYNETINPESWLYFYDKGRLVRITHLEDTIPDESEIYSYNSDGTLNKVEFERQYGIIGTYTLFYTNGKVSSIENDQGIYYHDTVQFTYSGDKVTASFGYGSVYAHLNGENQIMSLIKPNTERTDSLVFTWQEGNVTSIKFYEYYSKNLIHTREFEYDNGINYVKAIHYPAEWMFYFSLFNNDNLEYYTNNNCTKFSMWNTGNNPDIFNTTYPEYSPENYPLKMNTQYYNYEFEYTVE